MRSLEETLRGFVNETRCWEERCFLRSEKTIAGLLSYNEAVSIGSSEYMEIFNRYCSLSKGRPRDFFYDHPPDYDSERETIVSVKMITPGIAELRTQQHYGYRKSHLYRLTLEEGEWKLFEMAILTDNGEMLEASL